MAVNAYLNFTVMMALHSRLNHRTLYTQGGPRYPTIALTSSRSSILGRRVRVRARGRSRSTRSR